MRVLKVKVISLPYIFKVLYVLCLRWAKISGERLQDHWSSGQRSSSLKPLGQSKPNFMWNLLGKEEQKFIKMVQVT